MSNDHNHNILGVYVGPHGVSLTVLSQGTPLAAIQMERLVGIRRAWVCDGVWNHDFVLERLQEDPQDEALRFSDHFPAVVDFVLRSASLSLSDIDIVALEKRNIMNCRLGGTSVDSNNALDAYFEKQTKVYVEHHQGHQAQAFYASRFNNALVLTVDGRSWDSLERVGAPLSLTVSIGTEELITPIYECSRSLTSTYDWISRKLFGRRYCEGKTMGLAAYGAANAYGIDVANRTETSCCAARDATGCSRQRYGASEFCWLHDAINQNYVRKWLEPHPDSALNLFTSCDGIDYLSNVDVGRALWKYPQLSLLERDAPPLLGHKQVAWLCQHKYEEALFCLLNRAWNNISSEAHSNNLCVAGGGGLNSVANGKIHSRTPFQNVFIFPNCGDEGLSFGFALWAQHAVCKQHRKWSLSTDYFGSSYNHDHILMAIEPYMESYDIDVYDSTDEMIRSVAHLLCECSIIGWFQGRSEFGPRSLGNRSILAHPGHEHIRTRLNRDIKKREIWRPFAPVVMHEYVQQFFDIPQESPHMLIVGTVRCEKRHTIPGVVHVDGTARVQTLRNEDNPRLYGLLREFHRLTNVPLLVNTSFNTAGKPIVESPSQALACFAESGLDCLVMGRVLVRRTTTAAS